MYTRIVLGDDIWFIVEESIDEIIDKFNNSESVLNARVIDGYDVALVKEKIICFVSVSIAEQLNIDLKEDQD